MLEMGNKSRGNKFKHEFADVDIFFKHPNLALQKITDTPTPIQNWKSQMISQITDEKEQDKKTGTSLGGGTWCCEGRDSLNCTSEWLCVVSCHVTYDEKIHQICN